MEIVGKPSINPWIMWLGKFAAWLSVLAPFAAMCWPGICWWVAPLWARALAWTLYALGAALVVVAGAELGESLRIALPTGKTGLKTHGLYALSRNPIYTVMGAVLVCAGVLAPNPWIWGASIFGMAVHHWVVLGEERFLRRRFGAEWEKYRRKVRRYI